MSDFTILSTKLAAIKSTLETNMVPGDYNAVLKEFEARLLQNKSYPICALLLDTGTLSHNTRINLDLHVIALFHEHKEQDLTKKIIDTMEKTIAYLRENYPELNSNETVQVHINQNVLDPFIGVELPLNPPLGGFRLTYPNFRADLQTNTT